MLRENRFFPWICISRDPFLPLISLAEHVLSSYPNMSPIVRYNFSAFSTIEITTLFYGVLDLTPRHRLRRNQVIT